jgi:hypothetical protein
MRFLQGELVLRNVDGRRVAVQAIFPHAPMGVLDISDGESSEGTAQRSLVKNGGLALIPLVHQAATRLAQMKLHSRAGSIAVARTNGFYDGDMLFQHCQRALA